MPFKSKAQQGKMHAMLSRGEIAPEVLHEFDKSTDFSHLPARKKSPTRPMSERIAAARKVRGYPPPA